MTYAPYYPGGWVDGPSTSTPLIAAAVQNIENGLKYTSDLVAPDYVIFISGGTVMAASSSGVAYSGSDGGAALSTAISNLGSTGGTIAFRSGAYTWSTIPQIPAGLTETLRIIGEPGVRINLTSSAFRFLDFAHSPAAGATFQNILIDGFHVDISAVTPSSHNHIILGTVINNDFATGTNVNFKNIVIRNIIGTGAATTTLTTTTTEQLWVFIQSMDSASGQTNTGTDITVENLNLTGGNYGVAVIGSSSTHTYDPGFLWDRINVRNIVHDVGSDPDVFGSYAHVHVGGRAFVGTVRVDNIWGRGSRDVGLEIDNALDAHVHNTFFKNTHGFCHAITNFNAPANVHEQAYFLEDLTLHRDAGTVDNLANGLIGVNQSSNFTGPTVQPFGRIRAVGMKVFMDGTNPQDLVTGGISGILCDCTAAPDEISLERAVVYMQNLRQTSNTTSPGVYAVYTHAPTTGSQRMRLTLRDIDVTMLGANTGTQPATLTPFYLSGLLDLTMDNCGVNLNFTTPGTSTQIGVSLGRDTGSQIQGIVRRFRVYANNDTGGRGVTYRQVSEMTIPSSLTIDNCDFSGMSGGAEILQGGSTGSNAAKVFAKHNTFRVFPKIAYTLAAPVSNTATQYTEMWDGNVAFTGGSGVTAISISKDGTNFTQLASTTPFSAHLTNGDWYRVVFSTTAPTVTVFVDN